MRLIKKNSNADLRNYYLLFFETGLICALVGFIILTKLEWTAGKQSTYVTFSQEEVITTKEITRTQQPKKPPPPPPPQVPVEVPNDHVIEEQAIQFSSELAFDRPMEIPEMPEEMTLKEEDEEEFFIAVEQMPELIGGITELYKKIQYPKRALDARIEGLVVVKFIVTKEGSVKNPVVIRGIGGGCDEEAVRLVSQAKFMPGRQRDKPVPVQYSIGIRFIYRER